MHVVVGKRPMCVFLFVTCLSGLSGPFLKFRRPLQLSVGPSMSAFNRFMQASAGRRAYSYFSSRSGGGRYFTSAKAPKTAVVAPKGAVTTGNNQKVDATAEGRQDNVRGASSPQNNVVSSAKPGTESSSPSS